MAVGPDDSFLIARCSPSEIGKSSYGWSESGLTVRKVRGPKMRTSDGCIDEIGAAFQFPYPSGQNWNAVSDYLSDLDWLPLSTGVVLVVVDAQELLNEEPVDQYAAFVSVMKRAYDEFAQPIDLGEWWDRDAVPFHVVFQVPPGNTWSLARRWKRAGAKWKNLDFL